MQNSTRKSLDQKAAYWALLLGIGGLLVGFGLIYFFPQSPDGDRTALMQFEMRYGDHPFYHVHDAFWFNLAGALFAWGAWAYFLGHSAKLIQQIWPPTLGVGASFKQGALLLMWGGVLVMWSGWAWNQTRGWQGSLFLEAESATRLGVDGRPIVRFERFLIPPTPDGAGRALKLRLLVNEELHEISEAHPYQGAGWTLKPHWYGVTVKSDAFSQALFFGEPGTTHALLKDGSPITVTVQTTPLSATSTPPLPDIDVAYHAILLARFAPGVPLQQVGAVMVLVGVVIGNWRFLIFD